MIRILLMALLFLVALSVRGRAQAANALDWGNLCNPVLSYPRWSVKDYACTHRDGVFYLFFSAFYEDNGAIRSHVVEVTTRDFKTYSEPILNIDGEEEGWIGMCSPDIAKSDDTYYLVFNSWGDKEGKPNQLFYMSSADLIHWSPRKPLAANLTKGIRAIDAALAFENGKTYLFWKERQTTRCARGSSPDGDFQFIGDGHPNLRKAGGEAVSWAENYTFFKTDGKWRLICTVKGHVPCIFGMDKSGAEDRDWLTWVDGYQPELANQGFNTLDHANAATLCDFRSLDGHFYLFYAGNTEGKPYLGRGWNRLGLSRSRDLVKWYPAGILE